MPSSSGLSTNQKTAPNGGAFFSERPDSDLILDSRANALDESQTMFNSDSLGFQSDNPAAAQNREFPRLLSVQTDQVIVSPFQSTSTRKMDTAKPSTIPVVDGPLHVSDIAANHKEYFKPYLHQVNSDPGELDKQNRENAQSSSDLPQCRPAQSSVVSSYPDKPALLGQGDQDIPETTKQQDILHYQGSSSTQTLINSLQSSNGNEKVITFPAPLSQSTTNPVSDVLRINGSHSGATRPHSSEFIPSVTLPYSPSTPEEFLTPSVEFFQNQRPSEFHFDMPSVPLSSPKGRQESPMEAHAQHQEQQDQHQQSQNSQQKEQRKPQAPRPFRRQLSKRKNEVPLEEMENDMEMESRRLGLLMPRTSVDTPSDEDSDEDDEDFFSLPSISPRTPTSPWPRRKEPYDPYQIFEVLHTPCLILTVTVIRGRNITMGFQDLYDTPDPFLKLVMKSSPEGKKWTTVKTDQTNPIWNETFTFFVNFQQANVLEINLMEYNSLWFNQLVGTVYFDLVNINEIGVRQLETFVFNGISQVDIEFLLEFDRNPTLRYSLCLSDQEKEFIQRRKEKVFSAMKKFLGEQDGPACVQEVPTIAVIGSGGGFRAMTAYSGVFKALLETGILDCSTYVCGLSGSSWFLSTLYSHPQWPHNLDMSDFLDEIKNKMDKKLTRFLNASTLYTFYKIMVEKRKERQPVSFTDIFGRMVGETLIPDRMEATLTDQREKIKEGASPMPLYTCVHVKKDVPARSFQ
ncbi:cullin-3, partial [Plakobranchus ocellatus]